MSNRPTAFVILHLSFTILLAACAPSPAVPSVIYITATPPPTASAVAVAEVTNVFSVANGAISTPNSAPSGPTATPFPTTDYQSSIGATSPTAPPPTIDALSFDFGTVTPFPTLDWRPPPMPVPVSIRPEDHFWFQRPIASNAVNWPHPLYRYGSTYFGVMNAHTGVDLDSPLGTPVLAAGDGVVVWTGFGLLGVRPAENDPYGLAVVIKHNFGYNNKDMYTVYAHMSEINVWPDQPLRAGEQIGKVGLTGFTSGPHLHFEVRIGENKFRDTYNSELWLAPPTGWGVLAGRVLDASGNYISELPIEIYDSAGRYYPLVTYSTRNVNPDPVYQENFAISDLPADTYSYAVNIFGERYIGVAEILPGQTTFVIVQEGMEKRNIPRTADPLATDGPYPSTGTPRTPRPPPPTATLIPILTSTPSATP
jgi:murein DD-endopeptidase MepM/ murein hydrolase activator NlpD